MRLRRIQTWKNTRIAKNCGWVATNARRSRLRPETVAIQESASRPPAILSKLRNDPASGTMFRNASSAYRHRPTARSAITIVTNASAIAAATPSRGSTPASAPTPAAVANSAAGSVQLRVSVEGTTRDVLLSG